MAAGSPPRAPQKCIYWPWAFNLWKSSFIRILVILSDRIQLYTSNLKDRSWLLSSSNGADGLVLGVLVRVQCYASASEEAPHD